MERLRTLVAAYPRMLWLLGFGAFLNVAGLSFIWPINTLYIHQHLGRPLAVAGLVLFLHSGAGALGSLLGGYLFDRIGGRRVMLLGLLCSAGFIALPGLVESWPLYVGVMILFGLSASMIFPATNALAYRAWPEGGRRGFNFIYVCHNIGVAVGTALGGILAQRSYSLAFLSAAATALLFALFVYVGIRDGDAAERLGSDSVVVKEEKGSIPWFPVGALFAGLLITWLVYVQWQSAISVYMQGLGIPLSAYSFLWTLNGLVIVAGQPLLSLLLRAVRSLVAQLLLGTALFAGCYMLLLTGQTYSIFVAGMVLLSLGEMIIFPGVPAAVAAVSPPDRRGFLQGFISSAATAGRMVGPLAGGIVYDRFGFAPLLLLMTSLLAVPAGCYLLYGWSRRGRAARQSA